MAREFEFSGFEEEEIEKPSGSLSEMAKKAFLTGIGALFMTEESVRNAFNEMKLPKEAVGFVMDQAKKQKDDLVSAIAHEVSNFLSKIKVQEEVQKALSQLELHIDAKLSFVPKGTAQLGDLKLKVKKKRG